jgi:hypothetical protein
MLKKFFVFFIVSVTIFSVSGVVGASMLIPAADQAKDHAMAPEKSPVITESGGDWWLERVDFIHYIKPTSPGKPAKSDNCYKLMGVKWTTLPVGYVINPTNPQGLDQNSITSEFSKSVETWDGATSADLFGNYAVDYGAQYGVQDYKNAIDFGNYPQSGVIAVTSVWYTRLGKKIVEFDIRFNAPQIWGSCFARFNRVDNNLSICYIVFI